MKLKPSSINLDLNVRKHQPSKLVFFFLGAVILFTGCSKQIEKKPSLTMTEAQKKFEDKCLKDFNLHVRSHQIGKTFWVYLPINCTGVAAEAERQSLRAQRIRQRTAKQDNDGCIRNSL